MKDQVVALRARGVVASALHSTAPDAIKAAILEDLSSGAPATRLLYVTPERLASGGLDRPLRALAGAGLLALFAVDEAHCISSWGTQFRPDYRQLGTLRTRFPGVPIVALTATATPDVLDDIVAQLGIRDRAHAVFRRSFNRPNLAYRVLYKDLLPDPMGHMVAAIRTAVGAGGAVLAASTSSSSCNSSNGGSAAATTSPAAGSAVVYTHSRKDVEAIAAALAKAGVHAVAYHAGLPDRQRNANQEAWTRGRVPVVVATVAFGMGVDKADVRLVAHWMPPKSVEGYYQEAGRAGRDGLSAQCLLYYSRSDREYLQYLAQQEEGRAGPGSGSQFAPLALAAVSTASGKGPSRPALLISMTLGSGGGGGGGGSVGSAAAASSPAAPASFLSGHGPPMRPQPPQPLAQRPRRTAVEEVAEVASYCEQPACRRAAILAHFGERAPPGGCGRGAQQQQQQLCDYCAAPDRVARDAGLIASGASRSALRRRAAADDSTISDDAEDAAQAALRAQDEALAAELGAFDHYDGGGGKRRRVGAAGVQRVMTTGDEEAQAYDDGDGDASDGYGSSGAGDGLARADASVLLRHPLHDGGGTFSELDTVAAASRAALPATAASAAARQQPARIVIRPRGATAGGSASAASVSTGPGQAAAPVGARRPTSLQLAAAAGAGARSAGGAARKPTLAAPAFAAAVQQQPASTVVPIAVDRAAMWDHYARLEAAERATSAAAQPASRVALARARLAGQSGRASGQGWDQGC
jgi:hypothetical protein